MLLMSLTLQHSGLTWLPNWENGLLTALHAQLTGNMASILMSSQPQNKAAQHSQGQVYPIWLPDFQCVAALQRAAQHMATQHSQEHGCPTDTDLGIQQATLCLSPLGR